MWAKKREGKKEKGHSLLFHYKNAVFAYPETE